MKIEHSLAPKSPQEYFTTLIEIFCAMGVDYQFRLTRREIEYFMQCIFLQADGYSLDSTHATETLKELFKTSRDPAQQVYQYRLKLKRKKWLVQNKENLEVMPFFNLKNHKDPWSIDLHLKMHLRRSGSVRSSRTMEPSTA